MRISGPGSRLEPRGAPTYSPPSVREGADRTAPLPLRSPPSEREGTAPLGPLFCARARRHRRALGFTLIEMMIVVAIIAIASAVAGLALRDPAASKLEHEATRLVSLLE